MDLVERAAREAGKILLKLKNRLERVEVKSSRADLVSEADYESQKVVFEILEDLKIDMVGEENYSGDPRQFMESECFLVDPLDGTLNYVHGLPFYAVSIARLKNGEVVEGVVYLPESDEMFHALKGQGAYLNGERLEVSGVEDLSKALVVTGWPYNEEGVERTQEMIERVMSRVQEVRILGSCAAELCYLAAGRIDGYFEIGLGPWDLAAGYLIAEEAGARVSSMTREGFSLELGEVVAATPDLHGSLLELVKG